MLALDLGVFNRKAHVIGLQAFACRKVGVCVLTCGKFTLRNVRRVLRRLKITF